MKIIVKFAFILLQVLTRGHCFRFDGREDNNASVTLQSQQQNRRIVSGRESYYEDVFRPNLDLEDFPNEECTIVLVTKIQRCITYGDINEAFIRAYNQLSEVHILTDPQNHLQTRRELAAIAEFDLTYKTINELLPQVDVSKTLISRICPDNTLNIRCAKYKQYRSINGICNNRLYPTWGAVSMPQLWFIPLQRADKVSTPKYSSQLPEPRLLSNIFHKSLNVMDMEHNWWFLAVGQMITHDVVLTAFPSDRGNYVRREECCWKKKFQKSPYCYELPISKDDPVFGPTKINCLDMYKSLPALTLGCTLGPRVPANHASAYLDLSVIYGLEENDLKKIRSYESGKLIVHDVFRNYNLKPILPIDVFSDKDCIKPFVGSFCFLSGDSRSNQNIGQIIMTIIFVREHNRLAEILGSLNSGWGDETIFQETRKILIAQWQHIVYNEFLPLLLNKNLRKERYLILTAKDYWYGYDSKELAGIWLEFSQAAFRLHSSVPNVFEKWTKDTLFKPYSIFEPGSVDSYSIGMSYTPIYAQDQFVGDQLRNHLFEDYQSDTGLHRKSYPVSRETSRKYCGLPYTNDWYVLTTLGIFRNDTLAQLSELYRYVEDIELWTGGISEIPVANGIVGPTFACIIALQFETLRRGDYHWYESPWEFSPRQLKEIKKTTLARLLCDNLDDLDTTEIWSLLMPDYKYNPRVSCRTQEIPSLDLSAFIQE